MNWNKITYKYYYLYKKISQIVFIFEEKTTHEYDSGTSCYQGTPKLERISVEIIKNQKEQKCSFFVGIKRIG